MSYKTVFCNKICINSFFTYTTQKLLKKLFTIIICLAYSISLSAHTENNTGGVSGGAAYVENSTESGELEPNKEAESVGKEESDSEPDSSYYSVNKFNILFYFVYKMKYMDSEEIESNKN